MGSPHHVRRKIKSIWGTIGGHGVAWLSRQVWKHCLTLERTIASDSDIQSLLCVTVPWDAFNFYWCLGSSPHHLCKHAKLLHSCLTLCNPMDCSPPGSSVHGILQARILECVAISFSRGASRPRDQNCVPYASCSYFSVLIWTSL